MTPAKILDEALDEIESLSIDEAAKALCLDAIYAIGRRNDIKGVELRERQGYASQQLSKGVSRTVIRDHMIRMYGICRRQADRVISNALQLRHFHGKNVLPITDNESQCN